MRSKLKKLIIDNIIALILSFIMCIIGALLLSKQILPNLKTLWFFLFFIGFGIFGYNLCILLNVRNVRERLLDDINELKNKKDS